MRSGLSSGSELPEGAAVNRFMDLVVLKALF